VNSCFLLWHTHTVDEEDDDKLIGVYTSSTDAKAAIERIKGKAGFIDHPDGFEIVEYTVGQDHWTEGFITWQEAEGDSK
jgi:hypothetical protein